MKELQAIDFSNVRITDGFWKKRQDLNAETTVHAVKKRFLETGRFDAFQGHWREGMPNKPYIWLAGDVEKWIEAVSYLRILGKCPELEALCDETIDNIEQNQLPDGYYNMWLLQTDPTKRWVNRDFHELYSIGHLIEAAVAYYTATGKDKLLKIACRAADHVETVFVKEHSAAFFTPGHEEIELALVRLYRCTGEKRYLELSKFFIDGRGTHGEEKIPPDHGRFRYHNGRYDQTHAPVREQTTAEGHAVRATYLYAGMADIAYEYGDEALYIACRRIFENIRGRRSYVTGGLGSSHRCEGFTVDYDLPNHTAYTESCAAIGLMLFLQRMLLLESDSAYADMIEQVLYNGFLSSTSLSGNSFFYENPLEIDPMLSARETFALSHTRMPITQRVEVFSTSCCPPNITRTVASLGKFLYTYSEDTLYVHQFMDSETNVSADGREIRVTQRTLYPSDGSVRISASGTKRIAVRIPGWCDSFTVRQSGDLVSYKVEKGYAIFDAAKGEIELHFDLTPHAIEANPNVQEDAGRIAIRRGPVIYCLEEVDNGKNLRDVHVDLSLPITEEDDSLCGIPTLRATGWRRNVESFGDTLYRRYRPSERITQPLRFIPYFAFANRGKNEMILWVLP